MASRNDYFVGVVVNFDFIQELMLKCISIFLKDEQIGSVLFENESFAIILKRFKNLYTHKIRDKNLLHEFETVYKEIQKVKNDRNIVAHVSEDIISYYNNKIFKIKSTLINRKENIRLTAKVLHNYMIKSQATAFELLELTTKLQKSNQ